MAILPFVSGTSFIKIEESRLKSCSDDRLLNFLSGRFLRRLVSFAGVIGETLINVIKPVRRFLVVFARRVLVEHMDDHELVPAPASAPSFFCLRLHLRFRHDYLFNSLGTCTPVWRARPENSVRIQPKPECRSSTPLPASLSTSGFCQN